MAKNALNEDIIDLITTKPITPETLQRKNFRNISISHLKCLRMIKPNEQILPTDRLR